MTDLWAMAEAAADDPIVRAIGVIVAGWFGVRFISERHRLGRAIARIVLMVILTVVLLRGGIVPYHPLASSAAPFRDAVIAALKIGWWLWVAWLLVGLLRSFFVIERRPREVKFIQELLAGLIYLAAGFAIIAYVFDLPVQGLLATSGAIAIILGLALQSTLNDVFSGLVLSFSRPYRSDDWIKLGDGTEGRVVEMNWRETHIMTAQSDLAIVPNSTIAKSKIVNMSFPAGVHGVTIGVQLDSRTPPAASTVVLEHAVLNCRTILAAPAPSIDVKTINAAWIEFEITFFVAELDLAGTARSEMFDLLFRHLTAAGISFAPPPGLPYRADDGETAKNATLVERLLELVVIFATLTKEERASLATKLKPATYEKGDVVLEPGTVLQSLVIIGSGVLSATTRNDGGAEIEVLRLGPGDYFGEVALLTGAAITARFTALTPAITYELSRHDLAPILKARPQVAHELSQALAQRLAAGRSVAATELNSRMPKRSLSAWFSERIHNLFDLARKA
jgi:small-conductance mechanosensitive channel/CRP-like cAMP-binding protein